MKQVLSRRWTMRLQDDACAAALTRALEIDPLLARVLSGRGFTDSGVVGRLLNPALADLHNPFLLKDMDRAVQRLLAALTRGETLCIFGDYDVDGITATVLLLEFFQALGASCYHYIPNRFVEGYGLSRDSVMAAATRGARVIVTVDCGVTAHAAALLCAECGIDLIITDHHTPGEALPEAWAVIDPLRKDCPFPCKALAGVGVAFNLMMALRSALRDTGYFADRPEPNLREYLDLVALGTIADIVPLVDENRILVAHGLRELSFGSRTGISALKEVSGIAGEVDCAAVGFRLAPRLNAAGRLEDAARGVELLLTRDRQRALEMARELDASNRERQALEQTILRDALTKVSTNPALSGRRSIVLASAEWHAGVIGIVASRLVDLFHRPTILFALDEGCGKGSGRSIPGLHLYDALAACSDHLLRFGGHKYAAGMSINESALEDFVAQFDTVAAGQLADDDLLPEVCIDAELLPEQVTLAAAEQLELLQPFGMGNPRPVFLLRNASVIGRTVLKEQHLRLRLAVDGYRFEALGFSMAAAVPEARCVDLAFTLESNEWNGRRSLQLRLKDLRDVRDDFPG